MIHIQVSFAQVDPAMAPRDKERRSGNPKSSVKQQLKTLWLEISPMGVQ